MLFWHIRNLKSADWKKRRFAAQRLGELRAVKAVPQLICILEYICQDQEAENSFINEGVGFAAAEALSKIKDPRAVRPLFNFVCHFGYANREDASKFVANFGDNAVRYLQQLTFDYRTEIPAGMTVIDYVVCAIDILEEIASPMAGKALLDLCDIDDSKVSFITHNITGGLKKVIFKWPDEKTSIVNAVLDISSSSGIQRDGAIYALGELNDPKCIDHIIDAVRDPYINVRKAAIIALRKFPQTDNIRDWS